MVHAMLSHESSEARKLLHIKNVYRKLPIHLASEINNSKAVQLFVELGQDVHVQSRPGSDLSPLLCASSSCALGVMYYLLSIPECSINQTDHYNQTALSKTIVTYFNEKRSNARRHNHNPPKPFVTAIYKLLTANADTSIRSSYGIFATRRHEPSGDALTIAVKAGLQDVVEMLVVSGSKLRQLSFILTMPDHMLDKYLRFNISQVNWVRKYFSEPPSLTFICRNLIREKMGCRFRFTVLDLPLPTLLKDYLCLSDLEHYCENEKQCALPLQEGKAFNDVQYENSDYDSNEHMDALERLGVL